MITLYRGITEHGLAAYVTRAAYLSNTLDSFHGLGRKFFGLVRDFNDNQKKYHEAYKELSNHKTEKYEEKNNESQEL